MRPRRLRSHGRRRQALVTLALVPLAVFGQATTAGAGASHPAAGQHSTTPVPPAIQHVIVVMQSGHSFDNYFGTRPGVDGIPARVCQRVQVNSTSCVKPYHLSSDQARAGLTDTLRVTSKAIDQGKMDGFVNAQPNATIGSLAMGHFNGADLPYYWNLADRFTLFDHFFAASQAGALPNRLVGRIRPDHRSHLQCGPAPGHRGAHRLRPAERGPPELEVLRAGLPVPAGDRPRPVAGTAARHAHGDRRPRPIPIGSSALASTSPTSPPEASRPSPTWPARPTPNVRPRARPKARRSWSPW